jgi:hypothetical protein
MTIHEVAGQGFTHQVLWGCAKTLLSQPETQTPADGHFQMAGMVIVYFTYEAYLNVVGPRIDSKTWSNEREFFSKDPYRGTQGKLDWICEKIGIEVERGKRPYQTITELAKLRDLLAHGKIDSYTFEVDVKEGKQPDLFRDLQLYKMVNREKADRALKDTEDFIEYLHDQIREKLKGDDDDMVFRFRPLEFPLASASGGTKLST